MRGVDRRTLCPRSASGETWVSLYVIANPRAAGGATGRALPEMRSAIEARFSPCTWWETHGPDGATALARQAVEAGAERVLVIGGDGTVSQVAAELVHTSVVMGLLSAGTGGDFARSLGIPRDWRAAIEGLDWSRKAVVDAYELSWPGHRRVGLNAVGVGLTAEVVRRVNASGKRLGPTVTFLSATLGALFGYRIPTASVAWKGPEGEGAWTGQLLNLFVLNGAYTGGGMRPLGDTSLHDGLLELMLVPRVSVRDIVLHLWRLYTGSLPGHAGVFRVRAAELTVTAVEGAVESDIDGESGATAPLEIRVLHRALHVITAK